MQHNSKHLRGQCIASNCVLPCPGQAASIQGASSADPTSDVAFAAQAGIPLPAGYNPPPAGSAAPALNPNPCLGQDPGFSNGLSTAFYNQAVGKDEFKTSAPTFERQANFSPFSFLHALWPGSSHV
jgi:hypothetical protein